MGTLKATDRQISYLKALYAKAGAYSFPIERLFGLDPRHLEGTDRKWASEVIEALRSFTSLPGTVSEKLTGLEAAAGIAELAQLFGGGKSLAVFERRMARYAARGTKS